MPNLSTFETKEERNTWYRDYRKVNSEKLRTYDRERKRKVVESNTVTPLPVKEVSRTYYEE